MSILLFKEFTNNQESHLLIVDVQRSFKKFFTTLYLNELNKYCQKFQNVYQIWDNHHDEDADSDHLYDSDPDIPVDSETYKFPNQKELVEKRYNYGVNADFYKKILDDNTYNIIKDKENKKSLKKGDIFLTNNGTCIVFIGNKHQWFHVGKKLLNLLNELKGKTVTIVGGSDNECLDDIFTAAESIGVQIKRDWKYIYTATHCPI